jgi:hypothetical protein
MTHLRRLCCGRLQTAVANGSTAIVRIVTIASASGAPASPGRDVRISVNCLKRLAEH